MANWNGLILTTKGKALQAKVEAGQTLLSLTKIKLGDGIISGSQTLEGLTDLVSPKQVIGITTVNPQSNGLCAITGTVTNVGLATGYNMKELGLFATDPTDGEILYAVTTDSNFDYLQAEGGATVVSQEFNLNIAISNTGQVTATIDAAGLLTVGSATTLIAQKISTHNTDIDAHANLFNFRKNSTTYIVGDCKRSLTLPSYAYLECTVGGTSGTAEPTWPAVGSTVTDGTVTWIVRDIRESQIGLRKNGAIYSVGDVAYSASLPSWARLECVTAGTTGNSEPSGLSSVTPAQTVTDGTVTWIVRTLDIFDNNSALIKKSLLTNAGGIVDGSLTANGWVKFSGGLILQWGTAASMGSGVTGTVTFPVLFANACHAVIFTDITNTPTPASHNAVPSKSISQFTWINMSAGPTAIHWFSIGC